MHPVCAFYWPHFAVDLIVNKPSAINITFFKRENGYVWTEYFNSEASIPAASAMLSKAELS